MNVFIYKKWSENKNELLELLKNNFPYSFSMVSEFMNDKVFCEYYLKHFNFGLLRDSDFNYIGLLAFYTYDDVFAAKPYEAKRYDRDMTNRVYVSLVEVAEKWRGKKLSVDMIELLQEKYHEKMISLTAKDDCILNDFYLKCGYFKKDFDTERDLFYLRNYN